MQSTQNSYNKSSTRQEYGYKQEDKEQKNNFYGLKEDKILEQAISLDQRGLDATKNDDALLGQIRKRRKTDLFDIIDQKDGAEKRRLSVQYNVQNQELVSLRQTQSQQELSCSILKAENETYKKHLVNRSRQYNEELHNMKSLLEQTREQLHKDDLKIVELNSEIDQLKVNIQQLQNERIELDLRVKRYENSGLTTDFQSQFMSQHNKEYSYVCDKYEQALDQIKALSKQQRQQEQQKLRQDDIIKQRHEAYLKDCQIETLHQKVQQMNEERVRQDNKIQKLEQIQSRSQNIQVETPAKMMRQDLVSQRIKSDEKFRILEQEYNYLRMQHEKDQKCLKELESWQQVAQQISLQAPEELPEKVGQMQKSVLSLKDENFELKTQLQELKAQHKQSSPKKIQEGIKDVAENTPYSLRALNGQMSSIQRELQDVKNDLRASNEAKEDLEKQLDSYCQKIFSNKQEAQDELLRSQYQQRTVENSTHQSQIEEYKFKMDFQEKRMQDLLQSVQSLELELQMKQKIVDRKDKDLIKLEEQFDQLGEQCGTLQERLNISDYDSSKTRIIHYKLNPQYFAEKEVERIEKEQIQTENQLLKERVAQLAQKQQTQDSQHGNEGDNKVLDSEDSYEVEITQLKAQIVSLQNQIKGKDSYHDELLKKVHNGIKKLREVCGILFGYKIHIENKEIDKQVVSTIRVTPRIGKQQLGISPDMVYKYYNDERRIEHVPTDFSQRHQGEVDQFIERGKCIPAFHANLMAELFMYQDE